MFVHSVQVNFPFQSGELAAVLCCSAQLFVCVFLGVDPVCFGVFVLRFEVGGMHVEVCKADSVLVCVVQWDSKC